MKEHKILSEFPCPACKKELKKSQLKRRDAHPVIVGYKCCTRSTQEKMHAPNREDLERIAHINTGKFLAEDYVPDVALRDGVNLRQPINHGLDRIEKFYTTRNLSALSQLWRAIHRIENPNVAGFLSFTFTSLYQRVTKLSEFRFWGGSGNTARFNVPYISNEANVFVTFARKGRSIQDHLESTATHYSGRAIVIQGSATDLSRIPSESIDMVFTDPPFGANINYSEMNLLWESWLGEETDRRNEAIMNKVDGKGVAEYQALMTQSLSEAYRILRRGHWMLLVFMNSSARVWDALRAAVLDAGFLVERIDSFDKEHGTFKQFVSDNAAGYDLVLHCRKPTEPADNVKRNVVGSPRESAKAFVASRRTSLPKSIFLHVGRESETDVRKLYSDWLAIHLLNGEMGLDLASFRECVEEALADQLITLS